MPWSDLTPEERDAAQDLINFIRAESASIAKIGNHGRAVAGKYVGNVETILAKLQGSDLIPNGTGLAGAQSMTRQEVVNLIGYFLTISDTTDNAPGSYNTNYHRSLYAKAGGIGNLNG